MKNREQWMQSKDKKSIRTVFEAIIASHPDLSEDTDMATFTRDFVLDLRAKWMEEPGKRKGTTLSASTINHRLSMLAVLLEQSKLAPHTVKHLSTKGNERTRRITDEEVQRGQSWLLANANNYSGAADFCDLITAGLGLAARQGELLDVPWINVNLIGDMPTIKFDDTKNGTSRTVPLPASVLTLLERRKHVKPGPFGNLNTDRCTKLWNLMKAGIGIPEDDEEFVFHALRHEGLSRLGDGDTNAFTIQAIAGHANVTTTQRYVHNSTAAMARAMGVNKPSAGPQAGV
ncbi:MAG: site-specific integrase [Burkholderiales bacterium]|nr:site-specific integrase [Burkholderiales bacterium]